MNRQHMPESVSRVRPLPGILALALAVGWIVGTPVRALADGPTTFSNTTRIDIPAADAPGQQGAASPYPSSIEVTGMTGLISEVTVTLYGLTHGAVNDIDALVVGPDGVSNLVVLSDVGDPTGSDDTAELVYADNANLTFTDSAPGYVPRARPIPSGSYRPTNHGNTADTFPAPAPSVPDNTTLAAAFSGLNPNGTWRLFLVDDASGDLGHLAGGWSVTITTTSSAEATSTALASSSTNSFLGDPVTFTASVVAGQTPVTDGAVQFATGTNNIGTPVALNSAGVAALTTNALGEGTHQIRATYVGTTNFLTSTTTLGHRVDRPTTVIDDQTFCNAGPIAMPSAGTASPYPSNVFVSGLAGTITKATVTLRGVTHQASIDLDVLLSGPTGDQNVFLLSDAGGNNPVVDADITFDDDATSTVPIPIVSGTFRPTRVDDGVADPFPAPAPAPSGSTTLATFNGGTANGTWSLWVVDDATGDTGTIAEGWCLTIASQEASNTSVTSSLNPSEFGASVTFTATVTAGGDPVDDGTVQFSNGATPLGPPVPLDADGIATLTTSALLVGSHAITASFSGTATIAASSGTLTQVVNRQVSVTVLHSDRSPSVVGDTVTFTATVTVGGAPVGDGAIEFSSHVLLPIPLVEVDADGIATLTTTLPIGSHTITASFTGTTTIAPSSGTLTQVVDRAASVMTVVSDGSPSLVGDWVAFTATVTSGGAPVTSGTVQFRDGDGDLGVPLSLGADGTASFTTSSLGAGTHTITATFSGTTTIAPSSASVDQVVGPVPPVADAGGPYTVAEGESLTLDGSGSSPGDLSWDLNGDDDFGDATGVSPTLTWADLEALGINDGPATHEVRARITAEGMERTSAVVVLTVTNTAPTAVLTGGLTATAGEPFTIKVGADDPSTADMEALFTYTIDWGDGSPVMSVVGPADPPVTHTYASAGTYQAAFTATDKDSGAGPGTEILVLAEPADGTDPDDGGDEDSGGSDSDDPLVVTGVGNLAPLAALDLGFLVVGGLLIGLSRRKDGTV